MKCITVIYEGAADLSLASLNNRTPLQVARCQHANKLAEGGRCGLLAPVTEGLDGRNEVLLSLLCGVQSEDAQELHRGPLEALTLTEVPGDAWFAYRGNFVTLDDDVLTNGLAPGLSDEETRSLTDAVLAELDDENVRMEVSGPGEVVVLLCGEPGSCLPGTPPYFMVGERCDAHVSGAREGQLIRSVMSVARRVLSGHTVNEVRLDLDENPANGLWLWGGGRCIAPGSLQLRARASGALVGQSRLVRGLASACGIPLVPLSMPWEESQAHAAFKMASVVEVLREVDHLTVYVESPLELGQYGSGRDKVRALERIDHFLLGPLLAVLEAHRPFRIVLMPDGVVSSDQEHPTSGNVPVVYAGDSVKGDETHRWDEEACSLGNLGILKPRQVVDLMLENV